jgi:hypothetical protein
MIIQEDNLLLVKGCGYVPAISCVDRDVKIWNGRGYVSRQCKYAGNNNLVSIVFGGKNVQVYKHTKLIKCFLDQESVDYHQIQTLLASFFYNLPIECQYDCFQEFARENKEYFKIIKAKDIKKGDYLLSCGFDGYGNPSREQSFSMVKYIYDKRESSADCVKIEGDELSIINCGGLFVCD